MDGESLAREYYRSIDDDEYGTLAGILSEEFVHRRPDRTIDGRDAFVRFMREERPERETTHVVESVYRDGDGNAAAEGRLLDPDGEEWFRFVDTFDIGENGIEQIRTYTDFNSG